MDALEERKETPRSHFLHGPAAARAAPPLLREAVHSNRHGRGDGQSSRDRRNPARRGGSGEEYRRGISVSDATRLGSAQDRGPAAGGEGRRSAPRSALSQARARVDFRQHPGNHASHGGDARQRSPGEFVFSSGQLSGISDACPGQERRAAVASIRRLPG